MLFEGEKGPPCVVPLRAEMRGCSAPRNEKTPRYQESFFFPFNIEIACVYVQRDFEIATQQPSTFPDTSSPHIQDEIKLSRRIMSPCVQSATQVVSCKGPALNDRPFK